jgi:hypothetical protein
VSAVSRLCRVSSVAMVIAFASSARAAMTKEQCIDANGKGQELRRVGRFAAARDELQSCAAPECPAIVRNDCTKRLDDLQQVQPRIVFELKDRTGADVIDARVSEDGTALVDHLDGTPLNVDPGVHTFTFEAAGSAPVSKRLLVREGESERHERVTLDGIAAAEPRPASALPASPLASSPPSALSATGASPLPSPEAAPAAAAEAEPTAAQSAPNGGAEPEKRFRIGVRLGFVLPFGTFTGGPGSTSLADVFAGGIPIGLDLGYVVIPRLMLGAYATYMFLIDKMSSGCPSGVSCSDHDVDLGIQAQYFVWPHKPVDPWFGIGVGYEWETESVSTADATGSTHFGYTGRGFQYLRLQGGADVKLNDSFSVGPFVNLAIGEYSNEDVSCSASGTDMATCAPESISTAALHEWFTIGARGTLGL